MSPLITKVTQIMHVQIELEPWSAELISTSPRDSRAVVNLRFDPRLISFSFNPLENKMPETIVVSGRGVNANGKALFVDRQEFYNTRQVVPEDIRKVLENYDPERFQFENP